jgi:uncharacterized membrane protein YfcA
MHFSFSAYIIVLPFIFLAGLIDSIAGGGGLISLPAYLAAGIPAHYALGNNKFSASWGTFFSALRYLKHNMIDIPVASLSAVFALIGSFLGTKTVLLINPDFLNYILIFLIPVISVIILINKKIGEKDESYSRSISVKLLLGSSAGLLIGFYDGFFGPGTGTMLIFIYSVLLKYDFITANGNTKIVNLASNIASLAAFLFSGKVQFLIAVPAAFFGIAGNLIGSKIVVKKGNKIIRPVFITALVILFSKIIFDIFSKR